jgi:hypothetical protein
VLDLALTNEIFDGSSDVFDGNLGVDTVLIVKIDGIDPQALERAFDGLPDVLGLAVQPEPAGTSVGFELIGELGGDDYFSAIGARASPTSSSLV